MPARTAGKALFAAWVALAALWPSAVVFAETRPQALALAYDFEPDALRDGRLESTVGPTSLGSEDDFRFVGPTLLLDPDSAPAMSEEFDPADVLSRRSITIEMVLAVDELSGHRPLAAIFREEDGQERGLFLSSKSGFLTFGLRTEDSESTTTVSSNRAIPGRRFCSAIATYNGEELRLYQNGQLVGTTPAEGRIAWFDEHRLRIGGFDPSISSRQTVGAIHSLRIYNRTIRTSGVRKRSRLPPDLPSVTDRVLHAHGLDRESAPLDLLVDIAIERGANQLISTQKPNGAFPGNESYRNGATALSVLALLHSEIPPTHPAIRRAVDFLAEERPTQTYSAGIELMMLATLDDPSRQGMAEESLEALLRFEQDGHWAYPDGGPDLSNTQFAALGLWAAEDLGLQVPDAVYERMCRRLLADYRGPAERGTVGSPQDSTETTREVQGFGYSPRTRSSRSTMTSAGLCVLAVARNSGALRQSDLKRARDASESAIGWLASRFPPRDSLYGLYGQERVGALFATEHFGAIEWYPHGAERLISDQNERGGWGNSSETSFALLFLTRATKKQVSGPTTGASAGSVWSLTDGPIHLRAAGRDRTSVYVVGFDESILALEPRIERILYAVDGRLVKSFEFDESEPWQRDSFPFQLELDFAAPHEIAAEVVFTDREGQRHRRRSRTLTIEPPE
ncbi:MAG: LamG-like jellyroll fold domain-containing protein [Planctomycetota bacterium]